MNKSNRRIVTTGYNYTQGFSWVEAGKILNQPNIKEGVPLPMYYDTRRVLSFLLAWRQFPLFNGMSGRAGQWIAFGVDRMRSELGIRAERVHLSAGSRAEKEKLSSIELLIELGLIEYRHLDRKNLIWPTQADLEQLRLDAVLLPTELGGGPTGYFNRHSFQASSLFYWLSDRLNLVQLEQSFNPFLPSVESDLKQAESNLRQTMSGRSDGTQASSKPDSSLHGSLWFSKDKAGDNRQGDTLSHRVVCSEKHISLGKVIYDEGALAGELLSQPQPLYQLLRQAHRSLVRYRGPGINHAKALELAEGWLTQQLPFGEASAIVERLISEWNNGQSDLYSPLGVLIKRLEMALSSSAPRSYSRRVTSNTFQAFSGSKTTRTAFLKTVGQKGHGYSPGPSPKTIARLEDAGSPCSCEDGQSQETACLIPERNAKATDKDKNKEEINPDALWQQTLEKLNTRLTPDKFQLLEGSRLVILPSGEQSPVVRLVGEWQLRQLGQVDLNIIRLTLGQSLGQPAWKLRFTAQPVN